LEKLEGFQMIEGSRVSPEDGQPETVTFSSGYADTVIIELAVNPWSGIAEIEAGGQSMEINLYDADPYLGTREYDVSAFLNKEIRYAPVRRVIFYGLQFILLYPLSLCLVYFALKKRDNS
jgi:hypothetical protein